MAAGQRGKAESIDLWHRCGNLYMHLRLLIFMQGIQQAHIFSTQMAD